jgi:hypothetical protein
MKLINKSNKKRISKRNIKQKNDDQIWYNNQLKPKTNGWN